MGLGLAGVLEHVRAALAFGWPKVDESRIASAASGLGALVEDVGDLRLRGNQALLVTKAWCNELKADFIQELDWIRIQVTAQGGGSLDVGLRSHGGKVALMSGRRTLNCPSCRTSSRRPRTAPAARWAFRAPLASFRSTKGANRRTASAGDRYFARVKSSPRRGHDTILARCDAMVAAVEDFASGTVQEMADDVAEYGFLVYEDSHSRRQVRASGVSEVGSVRAYRRRGSISL
ncbi:hypothetical protein [Streptomyces vinaceus]|uniref:hypothetical protein n=1 Tax=Streptomyces vinaceus TaxID=1960 RepID=UPI0036BC8D8A